MDVFNGKGAAFPDLWGYNLACDLISESYIVHFNIRCDAKKDNI